MDCDVGLDVHDDIHKMFLDGFAEKGVVIDV